MDWWVYPELFRLLSTTLGFQTGVRGNRQGYSTV
nr:unnamed protein product [Callosobruchus chinensis]